MDDACAGVVTQDRSPAGIGIQQKSNWWSLTWSSWRLLLGPLQWRLASPFGQQPTVLFRRLDSHTSVIWCKDPSELGVFRLVGW